MERIPTFKINGSGHDEDARPPLYVLLDGDTVEIRRDGQASLDEVRAPLTIAEARDLSAALIELLPSRPKRDDSHD